MASILSLLTQQNPGTAGSRKSAYPSPPIPAAAYRAQALKTSIPLLYGQMQTAGRNPYDFSGPIMGYATGRAIADYSGAMQEAEEQNQVAQMLNREKWTKALQEDPGLLQNPAKLIQTAMMIDPHIMERFKTALEVSKLTQETGRIEQLTPAEKALKEAQATQAGSQAAENLAGAQLKGEQAATAGALRGPEVRLKGAMAGKYERETGLMGQESKYRVPSSTYSPVPDAMVAQFWPLAQMNLPEELKNNASMLLSDPMTGKPNEAKIRSFLPYDVQQRYDAIKLQAEKNVAAGMTPQEAVQSAMSGAGAGTAPSQMEFRPPVRFN